MLTERMVDLHTHSNASDGIFRPAKLLALAAKAGLKALGLTDHDTVKGLPEAFEAANKHSLELVPGVEISILEGAREIHILGYYPSNTEYLHGELEDIREERFERMDRIVDKLKKLGFKVNPEEVLAEAGDSAPGRLHLARLLLRKKYVHSLNEAFSLYLNPDRGAYVPRRLMTLKRAMELLAAVKAVRVIAHPGGLGEEIIDRLIPMGLQGIEVFHPDHSAAQKQYYQQLALARGLIVTGGSDFHGDREQTARYPRYLAVADHYLDGLKEIAFQA